MERNKSKRILKIKAYCPMVNAKRRHKYKLRSIKKRNYRRGNRVSS